MKTKQISRTLAIVLALVMVLGMIPLGAAATESAEIVQWNVTLRDNLQANFYLSIPEAAAETATVNVSVGGAEPVSYNVSELAKDNNGYYCVSAYVAAAQMTDEIGVSVIIDGTESVSKTYTLTQYANTVLAKSEMSKYHDVVLNMLNYGAKAQLYFDHNADNLANVGHELENAPVVSSEQKEMVIDGEVDGISFYGATLLFQDRIAIRYYFTAPNGTEGYTFTVDGQPYDIQSKGAQYYVQVNGFNPQDYNNDVILTVSDGATSQSITYSPMHYITRMYNKASTSESLKNLLAAMYGYHGAACNLPDLTPEELGYSKITLAGLGIADGTQSGNLVNNKLVEDGLDMKYLDVDVSFDGYEGSTGIKYGATTAGAWNGVKIGLTADGNLSVNFTTTNYTAFTITPAEAGLESFGNMFNLKFATNVEASEKEGCTNFIISMWINDALVLDHLLVGDMTGLGNYVGILTWGAGAVTVMSQQTPEEMGYTRYTMADLGIADGTYSALPALKGSPASGVDGGYLDVDVAFAGVEGSSGLKIAASENIWAGIRIGLADGDKLTVRCATDNSEIFAVSAAEAGVATFTETFNLKVATTFNPIDETWTNVTISMWINDQVVKKNVQTGGIKGIGEYAGVLAYNGASVILATPIIETESEETEPEVTEPEVTEPEVTEPEVTEPEVTEPETDPTPEELGYSRFTLAGLGYADGTYDGNVVRTAEVAGGIDGKYLDVDVAFGTTVDGSSGIKIGNKGATSWDGLRVGLTAEGNLIVQSMGSPATKYTFTAEEAGVNSFTENFNLKFAVKYAPIDDTWTNVTINMWINDKLIMNNVSTGGIKGMGNFAGMLTWTGASVTIASKPTPEELGFTKITMADLGYADGSYTGNEVRTAEVAGGMDGKYLDVDVTFGSTVDVSSGIKIGNKGATSWDGLRVGLTAEGNLIVQSMGSSATKYTFTAEEAGVNSFTENFNLKFAVKYAPIDDTWTNVTIYMWINDMLVMNNVATGGIKGMGNFAGMLTWNGASITVATPA